MHISNDRYFHDRQSSRSRAAHDSSRGAHVHDPLVHRAHRRSHPPSVQDLREPRGVSADPAPSRQVAATGRVLHPQHAVRSSNPRCLASVFARFGLLRRLERAASRRRSSSAGCSATPTKLTGNCCGEGEISFEHAWFLLQLLSRGNRCRLRADALPPLRQSVPARPLLNEVPRVVPARRRCELKTSATQAAIVNVTGSVR